MNDMQDFDSKIGIYSDKNILTEKLEIKFQDKYLETTIFNNFKETDLTKFNYLVLNLLENKNNLKSIKLVIKDLKCKIIILFPLFVKNEEKFVLDSDLKDILDLNNNIGIVLIPEILGSNIKYDPSYISHNLIMQSITSERIRMSNISQLINTISVNKLVEVIVKEVFSFGISGHTLALIGPRRGPKKFVTSLLGISEENIIYKKNVDEKVEISRTLSLKTHFSLRLAISRTKSSFLEKFEETKVTRNTKIKNKTKKINNLVRNIIIVLVVLFVTPLMMIIISLTLLFISKNYLFSNNYWATKLIKYSTSTITIPMNLNFGIPFYINYSSIIYRTNVILNESLDLSELGGQFIQKIVGRNSYDLIYYSDNISSSLDKIHTDLSFLEIEMSGLNDILGDYIKNKLHSKKFELKIINDKIYQVKVFTSRLSNLLGMNKPMKYLVLFQNNMELRPTGGFIGSFALITFDKGLLSEIIVNDVYTADGQLNGHVEPPNAIRIHLNEGGWFMRDANWDPDFLKSAQKIEWFLDKEINIKVDGVIAIDLSFVKRLLKITGPLNLSDFDRTVTSENLYMTTQSEVESNFFPGSIRKASFMSALSKQLLMEIQTIDSNKYFVLIKEIYDSLESKHIQVYLHDSNAQKAVSDLGYSGTLDLNTDCGQRCFNDSYMLVDANLGVNKANYYLNRAQEINVMVSKENINHNLSVIYSNTASKAIGKSGFYKSYSRVLLPIESKVEGVRLYDMSGNYEELAYDTENIGDNLEIGFLLNILPEETRKVQIYWSIDTNKLQNGGEYNLNIIKQSGTDEDPLSVKLDKTDLSLTGRAESVYNTTLDRNFRLKIFLK